MAGAFEQKFVIEKDTIEFLDHRQHYPAIEDEETNGADHEQDQSE